MVLALVIVAAACSGGDEQGQGISGPQRTTVVTAFVPSEPISENATQGWAGDPLAPSLGNAGYDVASYELDMDWLPDVGQIETAAALTAVAQTDLDAFNLDFEGSIIESVAVNGDRADFARDGSDLVVTPAAPLAAGDEFIVDISYVSQPALESGRSDLARGEVGWIETADGTWYTRSAPDGAHRWFPANDHPSDRATFFVELTVPVGTTAIASGTRRAEIETETSTTWRWETDAEIPPHAMTVAVAGPDRVLFDDAEGTSASGIELRHLLTPKLANKYPDVLRRVDDMIAFLEQRFGRFPYDSWGVAIVADNAPSRAGHSWSILTESELTAPEASLRLMNDLASHYFGHAVGINAWEDVWLTASIPQYMEWLWLQGSVGRSGMEVTLAAARARVNNSSWPPPNEPPAGDLYVGSVSIHGALFLHALNLKMGDGPFLDLLSGAYVDGQGTTLTTEEFLNMASDLADERVEPFANAWFNNDPLPGFPDV